MKKSTLVIGVIGADCHAVGNKVLDRVFTAHDFHVINLGVMVSQDEYIDAAIETGADAIVVSSIYGHGDIDCLGLRERCIERGLGDILLYVGGNLVVGKHDFADVEVKFQKRWALTGSPPATIWKMFARLSLMIFTNTMASNPARRGHLMQTVSVDIGSTWTKAALFAHEGEELTLVNHVLTPTTTHHLADGFFASLNQVLNVADARPLLKSGEVQLKYSSSAKGGLAVAAMGLVPSITLESAKLTAHSAGAKIAQYYSYKLNRHDIQELESSPPDILLFTGGTDGGEESLRPGECTRAGRLKA